MKSQLFLRVIELIILNDKSNVVSLSNSCIFPEFISTTCLLNICCAPVGIRRGMGHIRWKMICLYHYLHSIINKNCL